MTIKKIQQHYDDLYKRYWEYQDDIDATEKLIDLLEGVPKYAGPLRALREHARVTKWHIGLIKGAMDDAEKTIEFDKIIGGLNDSQN